MQSNRAPNARGDVTSEHVVQLFDVAESLGESVASFLHQGLLEGAPLLVVAKPANLEAIGDALSARGFSMPRLIESGALQVMDAHTTLHAFLRNGVPNRTLFEHTVCRIVERICDWPARARIYGEMVNVLAEEGNYRGAEELEELWNELGTRCSFSLFCGYDSAHFAAPDAGDALRRICGRHTRVHQNTGDLLAGWLMQLKGVHAG